MDQTIKLTKSWHKIKTKKEEIKAKYYINK
jgi:hypothetical protein